MILLDGRPALSPFRLERLNARLAALATGCRVVAVHWLYAVEAAPGAAPDRARLAALLDASGDAAPGDGGRGTLFVLPRLSTISPWSTKATEIARGGGLPVARIERGQRLEVEALPPDGDARRAVLGVLHDPMTQSVLAALDEVAGVFLHGEPAPLARVALGADPLAALRAADARLGLALSADEIEYLAQRYGELGRDPSDAELMMFAQANSEHCRHKVFNATWTVDGAAMPLSLFQMIRNTHAAHPAHTLSAYKDNAAVVAGGPAARFFPAPGDARWGAAQEDTAYAIKVETHNHPTAIAPFPGASTGSGGEIRDEGATGRGAKPKAGLTGFSVSHLRIPGLPRPWEAPRALPPRMASAFEIMRDGPLGAAAFNNEFGRPALLGYFRSFELPTADDALHRGYDKPIMLAGGLANLRVPHVEKGHLAPGDAVVVLGGPAMLIGLGGGAASSVASGDSSAELDFASVQRDNPEMQRRCQEVIDRCWALGEANPIASIHDVGAGGLSNAIPEILNDSGVGGRIELRRIPCDDPQMSPMQIWCNESQERYVLGVPRARLAEFEAICARERCPFAVVGHATADRGLVVTDERLGGAPVDLPLDVLFGKPPRMHRDARRVPPSGLPGFDAAGIDLAPALDRVLRHPTVGSKSFLVTIGDRTVGGLCARDPMVGPWQVPVADCAVTLRDFDGYAGEAMSIGERSPVALLDAAAAARLAVGEAITNLMGAPIADLGEVRLSANWMAAVAHPGEDAALFDAVRAVGLDLCPALGVSIPVGKDSLSMQARWRDAQGEHRVVSPVSLVVSAFARTTDARRALTPELRLDAGESTLLLVDLASGHQRLGGSILAQVHGGFDGPVPDLCDPARLRATFGVVQALAARGLLLAVHDRSDGGLLVAALEMAFAARAGLDLDLAGVAGELPGLLFAEELGVLLQVRTADLDAVRAAFAAAGARAAAASHRRAARRRRSRRAARRTGRAARAAGRPAGRLGRDQPRDAAPARRTVLRGRGIRGPARSGRAGPRSAPDVRSRRRRRRAVRGARRAAAGRDPARAGRQWPGRDGRRLHPRRLRCLRRAHVGPHRGAGGAGRFPGFRGLRRLLLRRRLGRRPRLGGVDPLPRGARRAVRRVPRRPRAFRARRLQRLPDAGRAQGPGAGRRALADVPAQPLRAVRGPPVAGRGARFALAVPARDGRFAHPGGGRPRRRTGRLLGPGARRGGHGLPALRGRPRRRRRRLPGQPERLRRRLDRFHQCRRPGHGHDAAPGARVPLGADVVAAARMGRGFALDAHVPQRPRVVGITFAA
jgi:phosphoribosylformylglycinamidine synthase